MAVEMTAGRMGKGCVYLGQPDLRFGLQGSLARAPAMPLGRCELLTRTGDSRKTQPERRPGSGVISRISRLAEKRRQPTDQSWSGCKGCPVFQSDTAGAYISKSLSCLKLETREAIQVSQKQRRGEPMEWIRPDFEEVSLCCEINCYAPAEL